jgi:ABC-type glycerol-3-phosphate transport system permease component
VVLVGVVVWLWLGVLGGVWVGILPVLVLYLIFSRQLIRGITSGAVK